MEQNSPYSRMGRASAGERAKIYAEIYDGGAPGALASHEPRAPSARRRKRLALYSSIVGAGHRRILEIGCGSGDHALGDRVHPLQGSDVVGLDRKSVV